MNKQDQLKEWRRLYGIEERQAPARPAVIVLFLAFMLAIAAALFGIIKCAEAEPSISVVEWLDAAGLRDYLDEARTSEHGAYALTLNPMLQAAAAEDSLAWLKVRLDLPAGESWRIEGPAPVMLHALKKGVPVELAASAFLIASNLKLEDWQDTRRGAATVRAFKRGSHYPALVAVPKAFYKTNEIRVFLNPQCWRSVR